MVKVTCDECERFITISDYAEQKLAGSVETDKGPAISYQKIAANCDSCGIDYWVRETKIYQADRIS